MTHTALQATQHTALAQGWARDTGQTGTATPRTRSMRQLGIDSSAAGREDTMKTNDYRTHPGTNIISSPGKFEGEPSWLPELLACIEVCDEEIWDGETLLAVFKLDSEIRQHIGEDAEGYDVVVVWETEQGFATQRLMTTGELNRLRANCEQDAEDVSE